MSIAALPEVYQLRIRLCAISPLIWRRILVRNDTSIAFLHQIIQRAFGWTDSHLHRFVIHGKAYGIAFIGGITFTDDPQQVRLAVFHFRPQFYLSPVAEHLLDWFHLTMRVTVLRQQLKELVARAPRDDLSKLDARFESIKWYLWHGNVFRALQEVEGAHLLLQVRAQVLNDDLRATFERWYPAMGRTEVPLQKAA